MRDFEKYRRIDQTIDLIEVFLSEYPDIPDRQKTYGKSFLKDIEDQTRIRSRQAAAVAIQTAYKLSEIELKSSSIFLR